MCAPINKRFIKARASIILIYVYVCVCVCIMRLNSIFAARHQICINYINYQFILS